MAIKKTDLYSSLWQSCDELRGGMDASQYKDYILTLLFLKYVSDKYAGDPYGLIVVPEGGSFTDMVKLKGDKEVGDKINIIIRNLAEANNLKGVIDLADFNDNDKLGEGKEMIDRLSKLIGIFEGLSLGANRAEGDDLLGDAYEYLMRNFATESGKSKGQFYTPAEVSRVVAKVVGITPETRQDQTAYDPTCGSGSLLLKVADEAPNGLSLYGQEMDNATWALARMNMFLHNYPSHELWRGNTLAAPYWHESDGRLKTFDFAVCNPPFSYKSWSNGLNPDHDKFWRFEYGVPPAKNGDYAFLLHLLASLNSTGKGAIILPHGVLFRGNIEAYIRRQLVLRGYIKGIIGLPPNLFYGTGIPACIIVLDKEDAYQRSDIFMIDASRGFVKDGNKNRLRSRDLHKIVDTFTRQLELPRYSRMVPLTEIEQNEYNLNIPRYIDSSEPEDLHDLSAHLRGGIPTRDIDDLADYWQVFPTLRRTLFAENDRPGYSDPQIEAGQVKSAILNHPEFNSFAERTIALYQAWRMAHADRLHNLDVGANPKRLIHDLSEDLLARFASAKLVDPYAIYQVLMDYWTDTMQDDVYLIAQAGWREANQLRVLKKDSNGKYREAPDITIKKTHYKADLIPPALIIERFFQPERAVIERLESELESLRQEIEQMAEERGGEGDILEDIQEGNKKIKPTDVQNRIFEYETVALKAFAPHFLERIEQAEESFLANTQALKEFEAEADYAVYLNPLRTASGNLSKGSANNRIKLLQKQDDSSVENKELAVLSAYVTIQDAILASKVQASTLNEQRTTEVKKLLKKHRHEPELQDLVDLHTFLDLLNREKTTDAKAKAARLALDKKVVAKYPLLTKAEIKPLVIDDKWQAALQTAIQTEIERVPQHLTNRVQELEERYAEPLPQIIDEVDQIATMVDEHLKRMGLEW